MITLRMLGIAVAILFAIPIGFGLADLPSVQVPGGEVVDFAADAAATVTDIALVEPPILYTRNATHNWPEQLVEGHTVFVQVYIPLIPNITNWSADIIGDIECQVHQNTTGRYFAGVPIPTRINEAHAECHAAGQVFVTPDPFYDSDETTYSSQWQPTGSDIPFTAPNGVRGVAKEYTALMITEDWLGHQRSKTIYAWSVPIIQPWTHTDGSTKSWYCPVPIARLGEMDVSRLRGVVAHDPDTAFAMK